MKDGLFKAYRELQSERLLLREITEQDVEDVFEIYSNKEVMLYFADRFPFEKKSEAETMIRLLEKLGFKYEGTLRKHEMCRGDFVDIQMFSLLREDLDYFVR